jgi:hypothetical protein
MNLKTFKSFFKSPKSNLDKFVSEHPNFQIIKDEGIDYLGIDRNVGADEVSEILKILHEEKLALTFHDTVHPTLSDPGAYFSYSTEKSKDEKYWSMTYGNHGWSGGIYQIRDFSLAKQIISLIKKEKLERIQISDVIFFSHYDTKSEEDSKKKDSEIQEMHRKMTTEEIINKISSKDSHQIWESSCEIIALGQDREAIKPLISLTDKVNVLTKDIKLGGAFASNKRFVSGAIKTLEFHRDSKECTCQLYGIHDCMNPNNEVKKGFLTIDNIVRIEEKWVDYYEASCTRCQQKFQIEEREGHYMWWAWKRIN